MDVDNPLSRYLARTGRSKYSLAKAAELPWKTVHRLAKGKHTPGLRVAQAIESATEGEVSAAELLGIESSTLATVSQSASPAQTKRAS